MNPFVFLSPLLRKDHPVKGIRTVLLLGGTGTWGQAATRFLLEQTAVTIRIFSRDELKQSEMARQFESDRLRFLLGDIRDLRRLRVAMHGVDIAFHAAALKQVPSGEYNIHEVVATNVIGTQNVMMAASDAGVQRVVFLSSDKSVAAINSYGVSKALAERVTTQANSYAPQGTVYVCVRYGNVWQSRGSVGLLWQAALRAGKPLPVTDLSMTRFFITVEKAVETAWFAARYAPRGSILVPMLPAYTMHDLCQAVCEIAGMASCEVLHIGVRPGEKYHESLLGYDECARLAEYLPPNGSGGCPYFCVEPMLPSWEICQRSEWLCPRGGEWQEAKLEAYASDTWPWRLSVEELKARLRVPERGRTYVADS